MKIATFNANSVRARMPIILSWLENNSPDVLCIQETKAQDKDFPVDAIKDAGYNCVFKGQKSYNGVAILSKHEITDVEAGFDDEPCDYSRLIKAKIKGVNIVNTYVPQGREPDSEFYLYKLEWFKRLKKYFQQRFTPQSKLLWMGDLNVAPEDIDVYAPKRLDGHVCFNRQLTERLYDTMDFGLVDLFRLHNKEPKQYTFYDYRSKDGVKKGNGWRLDHIMATKAMADKCIKCEIDIKPRTANRPSDHTFLTAYFD